MWLFYTRRLRHFMDGVWSPPSSVKSDSSKSLCLVRLVPCPSLVVHGDGTHHLVLLLGALYQDPAIMSHSPREFLAGSPDRARHLASPSFTLLAWKHASSTIL